MKGAFALVAVLCAVTAALASDIAPYGRGSFADIRKAYAGRPLVVHFWSVTCIPCLTEMPRLAAFAKDVSDVAFVFVATDPIEQTPRIMSRLEKFGLRDAENYAYADAFEERLRFEVDRTWRGELPFTALVRADGSLTTVVGELEPKTLADWRTQAGDR